MNKPSPKQGKIMTTAKKRSLPSEPSNKPGWLGQKTRKTWAILSLAAKRFLQIDGIQWAGTFAFNVFFSLFPLMILLVTVSSFFIDRNIAGKEVIAYVENYVPISGEMQQYIFETIAGVIKAREQAGIIAFLFLVWVSLQCFITLTSAVNRAWGIKIYNWWRLPLKSLVFLIILVSMVILAIVVSMVKAWLFPVNIFSYRVYALGSFFIPLLAVFLVLSMFYRLAPHRPTRFGEVWISALFCTALFQVAESIFVIYLNKVATLNAVYGAFGGIMALLLWIYLSGCIFILGACLCAAQTEIHSVPVQIKL